MSSEIRLPLSVPVFQILLSVMDEALHGYALLQDIEERTDGEVVLTASTLYGALKRMLQDGWVTEVASPEADDDPRRRYYAITPLGRRAVEEEAARLARALEAARARGVVASGERLARS